MSLNQAQSPSRRLEPGSMFDERYRVISHIGSGGMANVYKVHHLHLDQSMALKLLRRDMCSDARRVKRFKQEAITVARIKHPNLVNVHGFGIVDGTPYLCMEYVEGDSLNMILDAHGAMSAARVVLAGLQIAAALGFLHEHGIMHRDVKPSNVIGTADGVFKLADFGLAKLTIATDTDEDAETGDLNTSPQSLTQTGAIIGTPAYMSPEQSIGGTVDTRSDIYSFGCLLFELSTGKSPYQAESHYEMLAQHLKAPVPSISDLVAGFGNVGLDRLVRKCLSKDPADRPQTMKAVIAELQECQLEKAASQNSWRIGWSANWRTWRRSMKTRVFLNGAMAVIIVSLLVAIGALTAMRLKQPPAVQSEDVSVEQLMSQGRQRLDANDADGALSFFLPAYRRVEYLPRSERKAECAMWVGSAYCGKHDPAESIAFYDQSAQIYEDLGETEHLGEVLYKKGEALLNMQEWEEAVRTLERTKKLGHEGAFVNCALGKGLLNAGRLSETGGKPYVWETAADARQRAGYNWQDKPAGAEHFLKLALDRLKGRNEPQNLETRTVSAHLLAMTLLRLGRNAEARQYIPTAAAYPPMRWVGVRTREMVDMADGNLPAARADALELKRVSPENPQMIAAADEDLGRIAFAERDYAEADRCFGRYYDALRLFIRDEHNVSLHKNYLLQMIWARNARDISRTMTAFQDLGRAVDQEQR